MDFRTQLPLFESPFQITYEDAILSMGSCFAEHIGQQLIDYKFTARLNPFGILYNPLSIIRSLSLLQAKDLISQDELFQHQDLWHHYAFHSRFSHPNAETALSQMNQSLAQTRLRLADTNRLLITWGTAYAYRQVDSGLVVSNCHKMPGTNFIRSRLQAEEFIPAYLDHFSSWKTQHPQLQILLSVSPVRHLRDGLIENQRSKAILLLAAERVSKELDFVHYFPAYELILDDLRDYRFYEQDLAHPNALAVNYVWEYFQKFCFPPATTRLFKEIQPIIKASHHRPFHPDTTAHATFCQQQLRKMEALQRKYPFLNFSRERGIFSEH